MRRIYASNLNRAAYLPLVWATLRAYAETVPEVRDGYRFEEPIFLPEHVGRATELEDPAVFLASCYVWNTNKNLRMCRQVKERHPGAMTVVGGPHVPDDVEPFLRAHPEVDVALHKEGEIPLARLLVAALDDEPDLSTVPSASWLDADGGFHHQPAGEQLPRHIDVPSPWLQGHLDRSIEVARAAGYAPMALWETNRGCPYSCTFCDWGSSTMSKIRTFPEERLHAEIELFAERGIDAVMCCDANFGILPRDEELAARLVAAKRRTGHPRKFVTSYAKNANDRVVAISARFTRDGMSNGAILAMQSASEEVLTAVKRSNMPAANYERLARRFAGEGVECYTEVILGLPRETRRSFVDGLCRMLRMGIHDDIMIYECVVLPNSELGHPASRRTHQLQTIRRHYLRDDVEEVEVVVGHRTMSVDDWVEMYLFGAVVQALHNRGVVRLLANHLEREGILPYERLYEPLLAAALADPASVLGAPVARARRLLLDYLADPAIPNEGKIQTQPDMIAELRRWVPDKESWLLYEWVWVCVQARLDEFYEELKVLLAAWGVDVDARLLDLFRYQRASVYAIGDELATTGTVELFTWNWATYFADPTAPLAATPNVQWFRPVAARLR